MEPFVYRNPVTLFYGAENEQQFLEAVKGLGTKVLVIYDISFEANGFLDPLVKHMGELGLEPVLRQGTAMPAVSFVREQIAFCREEQIEVVMGIGGGICMDLAKTTAFGVKQKEDILNYLTGSAIYNGAERLPIALISTMPCSGTEMDDATQITDDATMAQYGLGGVYSNVSWLNPVYVMTVPDKVLARSAMTSFVHVAASFLGTAKSRPAEDIALMFMKNIKDCLVKILNGEKDEELVGNLMVTVAMHVNGLTYMGKAPDMSIYYINSLVQTASGLPYTRAITTLFPYWLRDIYAGREVEKAFFHEVYGVSLEQSDEAILAEGLKKVVEMYRFFGVPLSCNELRPTEPDLAALRTGIGFFGTIDSQYGPITPEMTEKMVLDTVNGNLF